ncbi:Serpin family [Trema orientale]|uniref:Serpin family n=1 Tax=Trema orientale TaxID=63057 RepID=A0A2P5EUF9_TREOI|nr:Serpin family [Trema orientale]
MEELSKEIVKRILANNDGKLEKNLVFSPWSINTLLSILASGLKPGQTLDKVLSLLGFKSVADLHAKVTDDDDDLQKTPNFGNSKSKINAQVQVEGSLLSSLNGAWVDKKYTFNPCFLQLLRTLYKSESSTLDFQNKALEAIQEINTWVENATKGLIRNLLTYPAVGEDTALILANTLYFKGLWDKQFDPSDTMCENFHALSGDVFKVPYMCMMAYDGCLYASSNGFKILRLPYQSDWNNKWKFSMNIFLPDLNDGLLKLLDQFTSSPDLFNLPFEFEGVTIRNLRIPKFKFTYKFQVSEIIEKLGLSMNLKTDTEILEALNGDDSMYHMKILHTSCIEVNEHGTEAAAVTDLDYATCSLFSPPSIDFIANHPFAFMIREDITGNPIFFRPLVNPMLE